MNSNIGAQATRAGGSQSTAERGPGERTRILVWDLPVRVFHWLLAICFAGAYVTSGSERWRDVHASLGYTVGVLIAFRLLWAVVGTRYARLASFAYGPRAVLAYLRSLLTRNPRHYVGHNPAGSWAIYAIVTLGITTVAAGYATYNHIGGKWLEEFHQVAGNAMLAVVIGHVAGVVVSSVLHRENLPKAMLTGYKSGHPGEAIRGSRWVTAALLAGFVAAFWTGTVHLPGLSPTLSLKSAATGRGPSDDERRESRERGS